MQAPPTYAPHHHAYHEHHPLGPPPAGPPAHHFYPASYHPHHQPHPGQPMMPPASSYHAAPPHYAPHHGAHPPGYAPHVVSSQPPSYSSYPPQPQHQATLPGIPTMGPADPAREQRGQRQMDTTGQICPPDWNPKVAATLWEDEGTLCFQVEARGLCVTRRHDNHMINGTKLLNVAAMTRGRRDGMLKSEKTKRVHKVGPMHLKGVWIPYERALHYANQEGITEALYPLFLHDMTALLHKANASPRHLAMSKQFVKKGETKRESPASSETPQRPTLPAQHIVADSTAVHETHLPHTIVPHPAYPRPGLERAQTLPGPPQNASSVVGHGNPGSSYEHVGQPTLPSSTPSHYEASKSVPTTPGSTSPRGSGHVVHQYGVVPGYDSRKDSVVSSSHDSYSTPTSHLYSSKTEMGPPPRSARENDRGSLITYDVAAGYSYTPQSAIDTSVASSHAGSSPQTAPGSSSSISTWTSGYTHQPRGHTLPSQGGYPAKILTPVHGYHASSRLSSDYPHASTAGSSRKRGRSDENDHDRSPSINGESPYKRHKTIEEDSRYRPAPLALRR